MFNLKLSIMRNFQKIVSVIIVFFTLQFTIISCTNNNDIINNEEHNVEQIKIEKLAVDPANGGGADDENPQEDGNS